MLYVSFLLFDNDRNDEWWLTQHQIECAQGYLQPLKQAIGSGGKRDDFGVDDADIKTIFSSIKIIINFHK